MAEKKTASKAQKAVDDAKQKNKTSGGKKPAPKKDPPAPKAKESGLPPRYLWAAVSLGLFIMFLVMAVKPDGALLTLLRDFLFGIFGKAAFYFSIPALLYLFVILAFSGKQPVRLRSYCLIAFVLLCGCIHHLLVNNQTFAGGFDVVAGLYDAGIRGISGGLFCGTVAIALYSGLGSILSYIIFSVAAVLTLLAAMKITLPSIIRAIQNRPRDDWEDEEEEEVEPAALVVNHIANKHIEHKRRRRQRMEEEFYEDDDGDDGVLLIEEPVSPQPIRKSRPDKKADWMDEIEGDIGGPVRKEQPKAEKPRNTPIAPELDEEDFPEERFIPVDMPVFRAEDPIPDAPRMEQPAAKPAPKAAAEAVPAKVTSKDAAESAQQVAEEIAKAQTIQKPVYCFPPIDLLDPPFGNGVDGTSEMRENSRRLNETLASFKIDAHIVNVTRGPSVTRYEVELDKGVRLSKLTSCADDIALSLGASGVRIAAVPGKISVVGIEVPNKMVTTVHLREVIDSAEFTKSKSKSSFSVGKDIGGNCIVGNIRKMPHMLIAGTTGSGKSVCMNSIIISLLYKASPEDVKLIMVDPKMVELGIYNGIPHLLIPVVTDPKKAAGSLQWAVTEMLRRYKLMSDAGVRDLESYNAIMDSQEEGQGKLPQVVIIVDELADLMLVAAKEVEDSICRIAQMGRAAGMHLIIATQRPSADVITGLMKANIPSRIAFAVASAMESRIILDTQGAEKLVGKGDMLYAPIGTGKPQRVQGCFVTDTEVEAVANYVKENYMASYDESVMEEIEKKAVQTGNGKKAASAPEPEPNGEELEGDEMLPQAVDVILETGQASVSMLQRRLKLGYARAARIVDEMEEKGIVGPFQGSKPRAILVTKEQWQSMKGGDAQMDFDDIPFDDAVPEEID